MGIIDCFNTVLAMKFIAIFLFILPGFLFAQKRTIKILDKETNLPVAYATVKVLHTVQGGITSEKGEVELIINKSDSLLISAVSYRRSVFTGDAIQDRIYLDPFPKLLSETIVRSTKEIRTVILGNGAAFFDKTIKCDWRPGDPVWDCAPWGLTGKTEFAERIDLPDTSFFWDSKSLYSFEKTTLSCIIGIAHLSRGYRWLPW